MVNARLMQTTQKTFHYATFNLPAFQVCMYACVVLIMWFGGNMILSESLQVGELTGFLSYVLQVMNSLMMLSNVFLLLTRSLASAVRVSEVTRYLRVLHLAGRRRRGSAGRQRRF